MSLLQKMKRRFCHHLWESKATRVYWNCEESNRRAIHQPARGKALER
jgi:hypothetical protein